MSPDAQPPAGGVPRRGRRLALRALLAVVIAAAALVAVFLAGVPLPGDWVRAPLERALTAAFGVPTRLEGPVHVRTGLVAAVSADALVLADPLDPAGAPLARATKPSARIDLAALARRAVALDEVKGERMELKLARAADGRANWAPIFATSPGRGPPPVTFVGIARLRIDAVQGSYRAAGGADPAVFGIAGLDGALAGAEPIMARGTARFAGQAIAFDLRTDSLAALQGPGRPIPVQGTLQWNGARIGLNGTAAPDASSFESALELAAADADPFLAALGIGVRGAGALDARGRIRVAGADASVADAVVKLGASEATGGARLAWGAPRMQLALDAAAVHIDLRPFLVADRPATGANPAETAIEALERVVGGIDAKVKATAKEVAGLLVTLHELQLDANATKDGVAVRGNGVLSGTRAKGTLDFDARKPRRVVTAQVDGGAVSTRALPREARPGGVSGTLGGIRGRVRAQGVTPREIAASLEGSVEARDVRWALDERAGRPLQGSFDSARLSVQGARASSAEVAGTVGGDRCSAKVSGGALGPLLEGERWPLKLAGSCRGSRLDGQGRIAVGAGRVAADLAFDASASRIGPILQTLGIPSDAPHPAAVKGTLALDEKLARVKLAALRLGGTAGSGELTIPLGDEGVPRVRLALTNLNLDEIAALGGGGAAPADPLDREVLRKELRLPNADFELAADSVEIAGETLRRLHLGGAMRAKRLPPAHFGFEWRGGQVSGELGADFAGASPWLQLDGTAQSLDLGALLARLGRSGVGLRVGMLSLRARAEGERLGQLLERATLDAAIERGRLDLAPRPAPGLAGHADFSATLKAAPGQPATLAARGTIGGEPFDLALDTPSLVGLARTGVPVPATLRVTLGDARLQAAGNVAFDGTGDARAKLDGGRIDRLGKLAGVTLPEVGPYGAAATIVVSADAIRASDVDVSFGKSRLLGKLQVQVRRGGRPLHSAVLRSPMLHLEDVGGARWLRPLGSKSSVEQEAAAAKADEAELARFFELLRASDVDAAVEIDALHGGGDRFASGRLKATLDAGVLRLLVQDLRTASGTVDADLRVDASGPQPKLGLRLRANELEYGPLARTVDPATKHDGRLDLLADLATQGPPGKLLPALSGKVDAAAYPRELRSEALDFWGTGLLRSMLRTIDPSAQSQVECAVTSLDIDAGVARTRAFFVDSTLVRIIGQIDVDLVSHGVSGRLRPQSERPELLTVAPTMVLGGSIEDPRVSVAPEALVTAPLRFATPLAGFAFDWLSGRGNLREGVPGCREAFDRARQTHAAGANGPGARR